MGYLIDLIGSYIIGGFVLLIIAMLNIYVDNTSTNIIFNNVAQGDLTSGVDLINNDFYKIGYRVPLHPIISADSSNISFCSDINDSGTIDTLQYYSGSTTQLTTTKNPNDMPLYRIINNQSPTIGLIVTDFKLTYYDSIGVQIPYSALITQAARDQIKSVNIYLKVESQDPVNGLYQAGEWQKTITPENLIL